MSLTYYTIVVENRIIAEFIFGGDRDLCIDMLQKLWPKVKYKTGEVKK